MHIKSCAAWLVAIAMTFLPELSAMGVEKIRFYDWQADVLTGEDQNKRCYIQFSGATNQGIRLSMHLSALVTGGSPEERKVVTVIKISAERINPADFSDVTAIKIDQAWVSNISGTSIGKIEKMDVGTQTYFLGGVAGFELFETLLRGIEQEGIMVGYRIGGGEEAVIHTPAPPASLFLDLLDC
ncbi:MAG: hypothetical protein ACE5GK_00060 [Nitrospiria bacterium]